MSGETVRQGDGETGRRPRFVAVIERDATGGWLVRVYNAAFRLETESATPDAGQAGTLAVERIQQLESGCVIV